ncbi:MAG: polysaccharide deacetylase family protein [Solirubrobacteraceae bacterium]
MSTDDRSPARAGLGRRAGTGLLLAASAGQLLPALAGIGYPVPQLAGFSARLRATFGIEDRTADGRGCALTFDDGPHPQGTPAVLEILAAARAHATFFLVGERVREHSSLAAEILAAGHDIGLHCDRHRNLIRLAPTQVRADITRAESSILAATGCAPRLYRPPYGIPNAAALRIARGRGWRTVLWSDWGRDWERSATPESIARTVLDGIAPGAVILLHDADYYSARGSWRATIAALPGVLDALASAGLALTAV